MSIVDVAHMRLYSYLHARGVSDDIVLVVCLVANKHKVRSVETWRVMHRSRMIDVGLSAYEAAVVYAVLHDDPAADPRIEVGEPHNVVVVHERPRGLAEVNAWNNQIANGTRPGPMMK
jgi:hypothetical protein